eukprot:446845-Amphidinium_carterae.1
MLTLALYMRLRHCKLIATSLSGMSDPERTTEALHLKCGVEVKQTQEMSEQNCNTSARKRALLVSVFTFSQSLCHNSG